MKTIFVDGFIGRCFLVSSHSLALISMNYVHLIFSNFKIYFILSFSRVLFIICC